ncbi:hypothetical protein EYF80_025225 [Liparis tanakae]|uniref:Uncharacterized protein n=1 Tax=Liparis tanakae TaxID=230148 RepID=A0A4Z2HFE9_9TELE|nr:hypothetical protein EYF80_025225 [Liparis tanakae]
MAKQQLWIGFQVYVCSFCLEFRELFLPGVLTPGDAQGLTHTRRRGFGTGLSSASSSRIIRCRRSLNLRSSSSSTDSSAPDPISSDSWSFSTGGSSEKRRRPRRLQNMCSSKQAPVCNFNPPGG